MMNQHNFHINPRLGYNNVVSKTDCQPRYSRYNSDQTRMRYLADNNLRSDKPEPWYCPVCSLPNKIGNLHCAALECAFSWSSVDRGSINIHFGQSPQAATNLFKYTQSGNNEQTRHTNSSASGSINQMLPGLQDGQNKPETKYPANLENEDPSLASDSSINTAFLETDGKKLLNAETGSRNEGEGKSKSWKRKGSKSKRKKTVQCQTNAIQTSESNESKSINGSTETKGVKANPLKTTEACRNLTSSSSRSVKQRESRQGIRAARLGKPYDRMTSTCVDHKGQVSESRSSRYGRFSPPARGYSQRRNEIGLRRAWEHTLRNTPPPPLPPRSTAMQCAAPRSNESGSRLSVSSEKELEEFVQNEKLCSEDLKTNSKDTLDGNQNEVVTSDQFDNGCLQSMHAKSAVFEKCTFQYEIEMNIESKTSTNWKLTDCGQRTLVSYYRFLPVLVDGKLANSQDLVHIVEGTSVNIISGKCICCSAWENVFTAALYIGQPPEIKAERSRLLQFTPGFRDDSNKSKFLTLSNRIVEFELNQLENTEFLVWGFLEDDNECYTGLFWIQLTGKTFCDEWTGFDFTKVPAWTNRKQKPKQQNPSQVDQNTQKNENMLSLPTLPTLSDVNVNAANSIDDNDNSVLIVQREIVAHKEAATEDPESISKIFDNFKNNGGIETETEAHVGNSAKPTNPLCCSPDNEFVNSKGDVDLLAEQMTRVELAQPDVQSRESSRLDDDARLTASIISSLPLVKSQENILDEEERKEINIEMTDNETYSSNLTQPNVLSENVEKTLESKIPCEENYNSDKGEEIHSIAKRMMAFKHVDEPKVTQDADFVAEKIIAENDLSTKIVGTLVEEVFESVLMSTTVEGMPECPTSDCLQGTVLCHDSSTETGERTRTKLGTETSAVKKELGPDVQTQNFEAIAVSKDVNENLNPRRFPDEAVELDLRKSTETIERPAKVSTLAVSGEITPKFRNPPEAVSSSIKTDYIDNINYRDVFYAPSVRTANYAQDYDYMQFQTQALLETQTEKKFARAIKDDTRFSEENAVYSSSKEIQNVEGAVNAYSNLEVGPSHHGFKDSGPMARLPSIPFRKYRRSSYRRRRSTPLDPIMEEDNSVISQASSNDYFQRGGQEGSAPNGPQSMDYFFFKHGPSSLDVGYPIYQGFNTTEVFEPTSEQYLRYQMEPHSARSCAHLNSSISAAEEEFSAEPFLKDDKTEVSPITMNILIAEGIQDVLRFIGFRDEKINEILVQYYQSKGGSQ